MFRKLVAEAIGTFWLVGAVFGTAIMAAGIADANIGWLGVAFAAGIAVLGMAYAVGGISGGHFNPAVTLGLALAGRSEWKDLIPYWIAQVVGGAVAAVVVYVIASGATGFQPAGFAANGYDALSPQSYPLLSALVIEVVLTAVFLIVILGATSASAPAGFAPLAIGLTLVALHIVAIPVTNASFNPARSTASVLFAQTGALGQLWLFWVAPLLGGALGGLIWRYLLAPGETPAAIGKK